jgi:hypothetical protein
MKLARDMEASRDSNKGRTTEDAAMPSLRELEEAILANGRVEGQELESLRQTLYVNGKISREHADFLVMLHKRVQRRTPGFRDFFHKAIKDHVLADGRISAEETAWLRQMIFRDGKVSDEERKLLNELKGEATQASPEFEKLVAECTGE